jgi:hypothetical protein
MNLLEQGFRFVQRGKEFLWVPILEPGDIDCTDMDDEEFERTYLAAQQK